MKALLTLLAVLVMSYPAIAGRGAPVNYAVNGENFAGYYVSPAEFAPLVLLVHDWDGLTDYEIKRADMLADLGYSVFAADLFGAGVRPTETAHKKKLTSALYQDRERMRTLLFAALDKARQLNGHTGKAVAMGYCFGGTAVLEMARAGADMRAFVPFHGGLETPPGQDYSATKGFVLVFHGSADQAVPMEQFTALTKELERSGVKHEMTTYSGAPHAFTVFGSPRYNKAADCHSWSRFTAFLDTTLGCPNPKWASSGPAGID